MASSVLYLESLTLVSQKTRLVDCGIFRMGDMGSVSVNVHLRPMSKLIASSSSVTSIFYKNQSFQ